MGSLSLPDLLHRSCFDLLAGHGVRCCCGKAAGCSAAGERLRLSLQLFLTLRQEHKPCVGDMAPPWGGGQEGKGRRWAEVDGAESGSWAEQSGVVSVHLEVGQHGAYGKLQHKTWVSVCCPPILSGWHRATSAF